MEATFYSTINRQSGLLREMQGIANNLANASTTGFREEYLIFSEHIQANENAPSLSMANGNIRHTSLVSGGLSITGGTYDLAIKDEGFFMLETEAGPRLSRAGSFSPNEAGELVNAQGHRLLDRSQSPIFVPNDASRVSVGSDGTLSVNGTPQTQIGLFQARSANDMAREDGVLFKVDGPIDPIADPAIIQGALERSNVDPIGQLTRMIEVQRSYELGNGFLEREDQRVRGLIEALNR